MFINQLRGNSNYPTFRLLAQILVGLFYLAAIISAVALFAQGVGPGVLGLALIGLCLVVVHALYEGTLMLADVADATVRLAAAQAEAEDGEAANLEWDTPSPPGRHSVDRD